MLDYRRIDGMRALPSVLLGVLLTGCGQHYWSKPGGSYTDFAVDHRACAQESALMATPSKEYGVVSLELYRRCLAARGWTREQRAEPVPAGWFRGIESDDLVRLDALPPQAWQKSPAERGAGLEELCRRRHLVRNDWRDQLAAYRTCLGE